MYQYRKFIISAAILVILAIVAFELLTIGSPPQSPSQSSLSTTTTSPALTINPLIQNNKTLHAPVGTIVLLSPPENYRVASNTRYITYTKVTTASAVIPTLHLLNPGTSKVTILWAHHRVSFQVETTPIVRATSTTLATPTSTTTTTIKSVPPVTTLTIDPATESGKTLTVANGATILLTPVLHYSVTTQKYKIVIYALIENSSKKVPALITLGPGTTLVSFTWPGHTSSFTLTVRPPLRAPKNKHHR
jgi:hypothetical protein